MRKLVEEEVFGIGALMFVLHSMKMEVRSSSKASVERSLDAALIQEVIFKSSESSF
jgi:hypothetical protein